jgi:hypothetical protein
LGKIVSPPNWSLATQITSSQIVASELAGNELPISLTTRFFSEADRLDLERTIREGISQLQKVLINRVKADWHQASCDFCKVFAATGQPRRWAQIYFSEEK